MLVTGPDAADSGMCVAREVHPWAGRCTCGHSRTRSPCWCLLLSRVFHIDDVNLAHNSPNAASALSVHGLSLTRGSGGSGCSVATSCLTSAYELSLASALDRASSNACLVIATGAAASLDESEPQGSLSIVESLAVSVAEPVIAAVPMAIADLAADVNGPVPLRLALAEADSLPVSDLDTANASECQCTFEVPNRLADARPCVTSSHIDTGLSKLFFLAVAVSGSGCQCHWQ